MRRVLNVFILGIISASFLLAIPEINFLAQPASAIWVSAGHAVACSGAPEFPGGTASNAHGTTLAATGSATSPCTGHAGAVTARTGIVCSP